MRDMIRDAITRLDDIRTDLNVPTLVPEQADSIAHRTHLVWQMLADRPWVTPVRLRLSGAIFVMDETRLADQEARETVLSSIGWCIEHLGWVEKMLKRMN